MHSQFQSVIVYSGLASSTIALKKSRAHTPVHVIINLLIMKCCHDKSATLYCKREYHVKLKFAVSYPTVVMVTTAHHNPS